MAETLLDVSSRYQDLRRENPIACGEWLRELLKEQGLSQTQIAKQLGANRQIVGRYLRMAQWNKELKELISKCQRKISNTDLLKAASSPKNERMFREQVEQHTKQTNHQPVGPITCDVLPKPAERPAQPVAEDKKHSNELSWSQLCRYIGQPATVFLLLSTAALSAYLIHQGIIFFSAFDRDDTSVISSSVVSELVPLLSAACFALCANRLQQMLSGILLVCSICCLAFFMQVSLAQRHIDTSKQVSHLEVERESISLMIDTLGKSASSLPDNFISRKRSIIEQIDAKRIDLAGINARIARATEQVGSSENISLSYGVWLRIAAMILNAILAHALFARLRRTV
jgi:predicted transcriptional regulator